MHKQVNGFFALTPFSYRIHQHESGLCSPFLFAACTEFGEAVNSKDARDWGEGNVAYYSKVQGWGILPIEHPCFFYTVKGK